MAKEESQHKYGYKFGNTDRGILLSILMASLFLVAVAGGSALEAAGPVLAADTGVKGDNGTATPVAAAGAVVIGIGVTLFSQCFEIVLILIVLTIISYVIYRLMSWLEEKCRNLCKCKWYKPWCCVGALFCWMVTVVKWVALVVTIILAVATVVIFIWCIVVTVAALLA